MDKKVGIIAALCCAFALCFTLIGCGSSVDKSIYTGTWELESGSDANLDAQSIKMMKDLGLEVKLILNEDGSGSLDLFGESTKITWEASSNTDGTITMEGQKANIKIADGKLTLQDSSGASMTFAKQK